MDQRTPEQTRADLKKSFSRALYHALYDLDLTQAQLADVVGVSATKVQRWCDPRNPEMPCIVSLALFPPKLAERLLPAITEGHHVAIVPQLDVPVSKVDHLARLHEVIVETSDVVRTYSAALKAGNPSEQEKRDVIREAREARDSLHGLVIALEKKTDAAVDAQASIGVLS
jgi:hypothetical protein